MDDFDQLDALMEALTTDRVLTPPTTPLYSHFGGNPRFWSWWGNSWPVHPTRPGAATLKDICYYNKDGKLHKTCGPAYISTMFDIEAWYQDGVLHRHDGPAYRHKLSQAWFCNGILHRMDGPAVIDMAGPQQYWIHGVKFSKKQYKWELMRRARKQQNRTASQI